MYRNYEGSIEVDNNDCSVINDIYSEEYFKIKLNEDKQRISLTIKTDRKNHKNSNRLVFSYKKSLNSLEMPFKYLYNALVNLSDVNDINKVMRK